MQMRILLRSEERRVGKECRDNRSFHCLLYTSEPLIYLKAAESMQAEPNETLVFEDALHAAETAVSYTHLDVYKRQTVYSSGGMLFHVRR